MAHALFHIFAVATYIANELSCKDVVGYLASPETDFMCFTTLIRTTPLNPLQVCIPRSSPDSPGACQDTGKNRA